MSKPKVCPLQYSESPITQRETGLRPRSIRRLTALGEYGKTRAPTAAERQQWGLAVNTQILNGQRVQASVNRRFKAAVRKATKK